LKYLGDAIRYNFCDTFMLSLAAVFL